MNIDIEKYTLIYPKEAKIQLSTHFNVREFACPCDDCKLTHVNKILVSQLESMRTLVGSQLKITSGYRCSDYQQQLRLRGLETSVGVSQHELGCAADVSNGVTTGIELEGDARKAGFMSVGVGRVFVHVDLRPEQRRWEYSY